MGSIIGDIFRGIGDIAGGVADIVGDIFFGEDEEVTIADLWIGLLAKAAKCDGRVNKYENAYMRNFYKELKLDADQTRAAKEIFDNIKNENECTIYDFAVDLNEAIEADDEGINHRITIYTSLVEMMLADGQLTSEEDEILRTIPEYLGLNNEYCYNQYVLGSADEDNYDEDVSLANLLIGLLAKAAKCDGRVDKQEIAFMRKFFKNLNFDADQTRAAQEYFNNIKNDKEHTIYDFASDLNEAIEADDEGINLRITIYTSLVEMMLADGQLSLEEDEILRTIPEYLGLNNEYCYNQYVLGSADEDNYDEEVTIVHLLIGLLAKAAKCDGHVDKQEIAFMRYVFKMLEFDADQTRAAQEYFNNIKNDKEHTIYDFASDLNESINTDERIFIYIHLVEMMLADGQLSLEEDEILRTIPEYLGLNNEECYNKYVLGREQEDGCGNNKAKDNLDECYKILGCSSSASNDEIKRAYKKQIRSYHPDVIASKELAPEFMEFAKQQTQRITEAYETIRKERGF